MTTAVAHPSLVWAAAHRLLLVVAAALVAAAIATTLVLTLRTTGSGATTVGISPVDITDTCSQAGPATPC